MQIIDLSLPLYSGMPVYPGDPEVKIDHIQKFEDTTWNMRRIEMNGHDGTHINVPIHGLEKGKTLDDFEISDFIGDSVVYESDEDIQTGIGLIFSDKKMDMELAKKIGEIKPKFVAQEKPLDIDVEKYLFEKDVLVFENLTNTDKLPKHFVFYGVPLRIKDGDGSPIRAFAVID